MIIAIDTGGTKTLFAKFTDGGELVSRVKVPTPRDQDQYLAAVISHVHLLSEGKSPDAISLALPGVIVDQVAVICKNLDWHNFDVIAKLQPHWPDTPIFVENDANLGGVGAAHLLPTLPKKLLYITLSTGVGGGFIVNGRIDSPLSSSEFGDVSIEYQDQMTTWENIASGRAVERIYPGPLDQHTEETTKQEIARRVSRGLMAVLPVLRPDVVAIGGGFGAKYPHIQDLVQGELSILPSQYLTDITTSPHPEEVVAYGCYYNARNQLNI